ncbi:hypothetical protein PN36_27750, partial [Candidatus Thiomargarita nelsonii]
MGELPSCTHWHFCGKTSLASNYQAYYKWAIWAHSQILGGFGGIPPSTEHRARGKKARQKYRKGHRQV